MVKMAAVPCRLTPKPPVPVHLRGREKIIETPSFALALTPEGTGHTGLTVCSEARVPFLLPPSMLMFFPQMLKIIALLPSLFVLRMQEYRGLDQFFF